MLVADTTLAEAIKVCGLAPITMVRVIVLIALASLLWVPVGIWVGLRPRVTQIVQPWRSSSRRSRPICCSRWPCLGIVSWKLNPTSG